MTASSEEASPNPLPNSISALMTESKRGTEISVALHFQRFLELFLPGTEVVISIDLFFQLSYDILST